MTIELHLYLLEILAGFILAGLSWCCSALAMWLDSILEFKSAWRGHEISLWLALAAICVFLHIFGAMLYGGMGLVLSAVRG